MNHTFKLRVHCISEMEEAINHAKKLGCDWENIDPKYKVLPNEFFLIVRNNVMHKTSNVTYFNAQSLVEIELSELKELTIKTELISGKQALIALANGEEVQLRQSENHDWKSSDDCVAYHFKNNSFEFRVKPRTIKINEIIVPAPFQPKFGDDYYYILPANDSGFSSNIWADEPHDRALAKFGTWRTEDEIKQVVAAYRKPTGAAHD